MAHLGLEGSRLLIGVDFSGHPEARALYAARAAQSVVLFPSADARDARELGEWQGPLTVWCIDGTWAQARKIWRTNPALQKLPAYRLSPSAVGEYRIRKEPEPHCLSTVEAVAEVLGILRGEARHLQPVLAPFASMVDTQVRFAGQGRARSRRRRPGRGLALPPALAGRLHDAVIVYGEANGWPVRMPDRPPAELLQWLAYRPSTRESFHCIARPVHGFSPTALRHQQLSPGDVALAVSLDELAARFAGFSRPSDVWCGFGHFSHSLARAAGITTPAFVDLRQLLGSLAKQPMGAVEDAHARLGAPPPVVLALPGRGARRLGLIGAMFADLCGRVQRAASPGLLQEEPSPLADPTPIAAGPLARLGQNG